MGFFDSMKERTKTAIQTGKQKTREGLTSFAQAEPQRQRPIKKSALSTRGIASNNIFFGNGAGMTGTVPKAKTKSRKKGKSTTVKVGSTTIKIETGSKKKRTTRTTTSNDNILNIHGGILG